MYPSSSLSTEISSPPCKYLSCNLVSFSIIPLPVVILIAEIILMSHQQTVIREKVQACSMSKFYRLNQIEFL